MKIRAGSTARGIALIIVMIVIVVLAVLAGGFAYTMRVETKLARNTSFEGELEWLGRSGVELGRYILAQQAAVPNEPWDSLNQKWAGGPAGTNEVLAQISLEDNELGSGKFSLKIVDLERKFNINSLNEDILQQAMRIIGADPSAYSTIWDSLLDWRDPNDDPGINGAESDQYTQSPNPGFAPYVAKNGPIDDISELLLIQGITPEMYWGANTNRSRFVTEGLNDSGGTGSGSIGLVDLFTAVSSGMININTASANVLQLIPGLDESLAQGIISTRAGLDGVDGTEDDIPFRSVTELINVPGMDRQLINLMQRFCTTRSQTFEIHVLAQINQYKRHFVALVRRTSARDSQILYFYWK